MALDDPTVGIADDWKASLLDSSQSEMIIQSVGVAREVNTMVQAAKVEFDDHFDTAGKQMAFLTWFESMMRDLLALAESSPEGRRRYNESPEIGGYVVHPEEFARARRTHSQSTNRTLFRPIRRLRALERFDHTQEY